ncbi:hypothetical protein WN55_07117 [Dufourea novaeangliae]|uniref:Uncharacterized protein n=1 Tax=Dufourea novaeangliae TaxID=178035 RepID=A0A154P2D1_DUFNO|nr:hypothetical protein WN55_07117 [Dufourea novaeangliae]
MAAVVAAYKDGRLSPLEDFPPYQGIRQHSTFHEQRQPFQEQPYKTPQYQSYRQRPYRQDSSSYREQISFRDYSLPKSRPFYGDRQSFRDASDLKNQASFFTDGPSFPNHRYKYPTSFKDEIQDQSVGEQYSYQQESFPNDFRISDLYKDQEPPGQQTFGRDSEYLKHGKSFNKQGSYRLSSVFAMSKSPFAKNGA